MKNLEALQKDYDGNYHDPSYLEVDRIIQCTVMFPVIHPKKANEMKGKWCELAATVIHKLLNF